MSLFSLFVYVCLRLFLLSLFFWLLARIDREQILEKLIQLE